MVFEQRWEQFKKDTLLKVSKWSEADRALAAVFYEFGRQDLMLDLNILFDKPQSRE